ncbi:Uncharacterised protein family (UPF0158) [Geobacter sp. DSM 9736]|nr:UPF0158 family protein [Geobacter sp. DSM 9736]SNB48032.1 Uncharacterised protein family (UPF0158) [Geobacter sp. DSM 9736]
MNMMRDMEIVWDDLLEAFANTDEDVVYLLDRYTGEIFFVPVDYHDESFWNEIDGHPEQYLRIPGFDYDQERLLLQDFTKGVGNERLKRMLDMSLSGKSHGRLDDILSFYPEELDRFLVLKEELLAERIRNWLEEHDIFPANESF